jgi:glutathione S-transferase kappa 1
MTYVKAKFPNERFEEALLILWDYIFFRHIDISKPENMISALADPAGGKFSEPEIKDIMGAAGQQEFKQKLLDRTQEALDKGAYGAPWFWVRNGKGVEEPFFGSDRFHFMWEFLELPWSDIEIKEKSSL